MQNTTNYGLKKPEPTDFYNIQDQNDNADIIDAELKKINDGKVDKVNGKGLSTNDYTTAEKNKLAGIAAGATKTIVNNTLTSASTTDALSAAQGKVLKDLVDSKASNTDLTQLRDDFTAHMAETNRLTTSITHGTSVVNNGVDAIADVQIEGRTLTSLGNATLDSTKLYVLADKRTKVKWADGATVNGIAKFSGRNEKPTIIRVANFEGKVSGSNVENPHKASWSTSTQLVTPSSSTTEFINSTNNAWNDYKRIFSLDGSILTNTVTATNSMAQHLLSFNLIEAVERNIGKIPGTTVAEKVQWIKDNVASLICDWYGFGSSVGGNKASFKWWKNTTNTWEGDPISTVHTQNKVSKIGNALNFSWAKEQCIDSNGFIHFLAYAEPSDGTTASKINTDYVELEIELKPTATLETSKVPLYEVTQDEYNKILVDWDESKVTSLYPSVEGTKHLTNPYVIAEGENLILTNISEWEQGTFGGTGDNTDDNKATRIRTINYINLIVGQVYTVSVENGYEVIAHYGSTNGIFANTVLFTPNDDGKCRFAIRKTDGSNILPSEIMNAKPMLTLGSEPKPFVPRNPSQLFADVTLGQIGTNKDLLYQSDGKWYVRKVVNTDVTPPVLLPSPQTVDVSDKVEGVIKINEATQITVDNGYTRNEHGAWTKVLDSAPVTNVKLTYATNMASTVSDLVKTVEDNTRDISVHNFALDYIEAQAMNNAVDLETVSNQINVLTQNVDEIDTNLTNLQTEVTAHLAETKQYAIATMSASQTIANDTNVTVKFDTITNYNGASFTIDAYGNFILNKGIYEIKSYVRFASIVNPTGYRQLGGGPYANRVSPVVGSETIVEFVREIEALEDNTVTGIAARHTQGTALDILSASSFVIIRKVA